MSRTLPPRPNLDHLKHQARKAYPDAQLADALHAIAKEYGFATWPKLKAHVEALSAPPPLAGTWVDGRHTVTFTIEGDDVTIVAWSTHEAGPETRSTMHLRADGKPWVLDHGLGYSTVTTWRDARTLEVISSSPDQEIGRVVYAVSADGATLTIKPAGQPHNGYEPRNQPVVFKRR